ncbi:MAG: hypothetical protein J6Z04_06480 [Clostridia bacterium]|nr:hypothetical protein [Clostridia bacterium]
MAKRLFASLLALLLLLVCLPVSADGGETARGMITGIEEYEGAKTRQSWLDGALTDAAGRGAEWYAIALIKSDPTLDFTEYEAALRKTLLSGKITASATKLKCGLVLALLGSSPELVRETLDQAIGQNDQLMTWVFGLHLLNAGYAAAEHTAEDVAGLLLGRRNADGGWSVTGTVSDVDVTAMTVQALAPNRDVPGVAEAIDGALALLADRQLPDGGFQSYGKENAESAAQVLLMLGCLGVTADEAGFAGGYAKLFDALVRFAAPSGGFCHELGGDVNELATSQVYLALSAHEAAENGKGSIFIPEVAPGSFVPTAQSGRFPFVILYVSIPTLAVAVAVFFFLRRRKKTAAKR